MIEGQLASEGLHTAATIRSIVAERSASAGPSDRGTVLVVDDEEDLADTVESLLRAKGYRIFKVHDGKSAVRAARDLQPDLVLLDYELPEMDGLEVIAELRRHEDTEGMRVLLASAGRVSMNDIRKADGFLAKPFQEELLYEMVRRVLKGPGPG
jgi:CheY-like chemotaxis protein